MTKFHVVDGMAYTITAVRYNPYQLGHGRAHEAAERQFQDDNKLIDTTADGNWQVFAAKDDTGEPVTGKLETLACCCCGEPTRGRQWHNRDTGYGLCDNCIDRATRGVSPAEVESCYGKYGIHFGQSREHLTFNVFRDRHRMHLAADIAEKVITENGGTVGNWSRVSTNGGMWSQMYYEVGGKGFTCKVSGGGVIQFMGSPHCPVHQKIIDDHYLATSAFRHHHGIEQEVTA